MRSCAPTSFSVYAGRVSPVLLFLILAGIGVLPGCQKQDEITRYTVKKLLPVEKEAAADPSARDDVFPMSRSGDQQEPSADQGPPDRDRMLAAIVPHGKMAWFFKMTGPREAVADKMEDFLLIIGSLKFAEGNDSPPEWKLPEGWTSEKGNGLRFATLRVKSADELLEATVIPLPAEDPTAADYVLSNVNRWCEQLGIPAIKKSDLTAEQRPKNVEVKQLEAAGTTVTLANLVGRQKSGGMGNAPFAPFAGGKKAQPKTKPADQPREVAGLPQWAVPEGWKESEGNQFSLAAFVVQDDGKSVKTTVSRAGGDLLANVNRWRGQLQLADWSKEEFVKAIKTLTVDGVESPLVELVGTDARTNQPSCTLGVIVPRGEQAWFFKLTGDVGLAQREKSNFEKFVQSVKFPK